MTHQLQYLRDAAVDQVAVLSAGLPLPLPPPLPLTPNPSPTPTPVDQVAVLSAGQLAACGRYDEVRTRP